jgi:hypothetical protein
MTTGAAFTGSDGFNQSVRLRRQAAEEAAKPREVAEGIADIYLAAYNARQEAARAKEQADIAAGRLKIL